jgi:hypothetical protein
MCDQGHHGRSPPGVSRILFLVSLLVASLAHADPPSGFLTPSRNIACQAFTLDDGGAELRCDLKETQAKPPPRPKDCELDWGDSVGMSARGTAQWVCHGDTVFDDLPVLEYGRIWTARGFTCTSDKSGLSCTNLDGHGWKLSKKVQALK